MFTPEQIKQLEAPLDRSNVKAREQGGRQVSYIEGWHTIAEANRIFGFGSWTRETTLLQETNRDLVELKGRDGPYHQWRVGYMAKVRITVGDVVREGIGFGSGMSKPEALGDAVESAVKEAETDAMKRALMTFGNPFGLALYDKTQANVQEAPSVVAQFAETTLRGYTDPAEFRAFWDKNKDGWKATLHPKEYTHLVAVMQECAKAFAPKAVNQ